MQMTCTQNVMMRVGERNFEAVSPELREVLLSVFENTGQTQIIEDSFRHLRAEETKAQCQKLMVTSRSWLHLIRSGILTKTHHFQEISYREQPLPNDR